MSAAPVTSESAMTKAIQAMFGAPLVTNSTRGVLVEAMIATALPAPWRWCSSDYASWDFEHADGVRLEVKQSAAQQTWTSASGKPSACSFDIRPRTGLWQDGIWLAQPGRAARIYVFAHHPVMGSAADHRDPGQWSFYVVATADLPGSQTISLARVRQLTAGVGIGSLTDEVERVRSELDR